MDKEINHVEQKLKNKGISFPSPLFYSVCFDVSSSGLERTRLPRQRRRRRRACEQLMGSEGATPPERKLRLISASEESGCDVFIPLLGSQNIFRSQPFLEERQEVVGKGNVLIVSGSYLQQVSPPPPPPPLVHPPRPSKGKLRAVVGAVHETSALDPPSLHVIVFPPCWVNPTWPNPPPPPAPAVSNMPPASLVPPAAGLQAPPRRLCQRTETYAPSPERVVAGSLGTKACS